MGGLFERAIAFNGNHREKILALNVGYQIYGQLQPTLALALITVRTPAFSEKISAARRERISRRYSCVGTFFYELGPGLRWGDSVARSSGSDCSYAGNRQQYFFNQLQCFARRHGVQTAVERLGLPEQLAAHRAGMLRRRSGVAEQSVAFYFQRQDCRRQRTLIQGVQPISAYTRTIRKK